MSTGDDGGGEGVTCVPLGDGEDGWPGSAEDGLPGVEEDGPSGAEDEAGGML